MKGIRLIILCILLGGSGIFSARANNLKITKVSWNPYALTASNDILTLECDVSWDNSWRDGYNWDAVYLFFKYRLRSDETGAWKHVLLRTSDNTVTNGDFEMASNGVEQQNMGLFLYRPKEGDTKASMHVTVNWKIGANGLNRAEFTNANVSVVAMGMEMVYIPRGSFRLGDSYSEKTFRTTFTTIPEEYDILDNEKFTYIASTDSEHASLAADKSSDNVSNTTSCWTPTDGVGTWWMVDFGTKKKIRYFGINAAQGSYVPTNWELQGVNDLMDGEWQPLYAGDNTDWVLARDAYPIEKALKIPEEKQLEYRYYRIYVNATPGAPRVKSIAMAEVDVPRLRNKSVIVDGVTIPIDSVRNLGARDGENWASGTVPITYPNGYRGFYAMKYELSQEQYVQFLNMLTYEQQKNILGVVYPNLAEVLKEGEYVFGSSDRPDARNGIVLERRLGDGRPLIFANNLNPEDGSGSDGDGQNIACGYMNIADMLAYADWCGLRPLTEMEFEKMGRRVYTYNDLPLPGEYAWNNTAITKVSGLSHPGSVQEGVAGNANFGSPEGIAGPVRVGAFAASAGAASNRQKAGAGFWGNLELSGNLSEIYYNANTQGRVFAIYDGSGNPIFSGRHGDGILGASGVSAGRTTISTSYWPQQLTAFCVRGGGFSSESSVLAVSDRTYNMSYFSTLYERDSSVTFRLGRSVPEEKALTVFLTLENGLNTTAGIVKDTICNQTTTYTITGSLPSQITSGDAYTFIWYIQEDNGNWKILDGEHRKDLTYTRFRNNTASIKTYKFKRKLITTRAEGTTNEVHIVMDQSANLIINRLADTITFQGVSKGSFVCFTSLASTYRWIWQSADGDVVLEHFKSDNTYYTHYVPLKEDFPGASGMQTLILERRTAGIEKCPLTKQLTLYIETTAPASIPLSQDVTRETCKGYMKDERDNEIYGITKIGEQCWTTRNMVYKGTAGTWGYIADSRFGRLYGWFEAKDKVGNYTTGRAQGVCPKGWVVPDNADWDRLNKALNSNQGKKLKSSKYWTYKSDGNNGYVGTDDHGFAAMGGGYTWNGTLGNQYNITRFWSSNCYNTSSYWGWWDGWAWQLSYDSQGLSQTVSGNNGWYQSWTYGAYVRCIKE